MKRLIFEDKESSNISKLIKYYYKNSDTHLEFTDGNQNLISHLEDIKDDDVTLVYIDVVPDNFRTIVVYRKCLKFINDHEIANILVLPIPCIEYFIYSVFCVNIFNANTKMLNANNYKNNLYNSRNRKLDVSSYEKYCKSLVNNTASCIGKDGTFYLTDCMCKRPIDVCREYYLKKKAADFVLNLPLSFKISEESVTPIENILSARQKCIDTYYQIAEAFKKSGYIRKIMEL